MGGNLLLIRDVLDHLCLIMRMCDNWSVSKCPLRIAWHFYLSAMIPFERGCWKWCDPHSKISPATHGDRVGCRSRHCWCTVPTRGFGTARMTRPSLWPAAMATARPPTCWREASPSLLPVRRLHPPRPTPTLRTPLQRCGSPHTADAGGQLATNRFNMLRRYMQLQVQPSVLLWYRTCTISRALGGYCFAPPNLKAEYR